MTRTTLFRYFGGKAQMAHRILAHLPPHETYVEPFGGAASVLLAKPRSAVEVYGDLDGRLVSLFRVLRDEAQSERLVRALDFTPYARAEYVDAFEGQHAGGDDVERARCFLVRSWMGVGTTAINEPSGFKSYSRAQKRVAAEWTGIPARVADAAARFRGVIVEHGDAVTVMERHDGQHALHYVDPPYHKETRNSGGYLHDFGGDAEHVRLLDALRSLRGGVLLSGYDHPLYNDTLQDWHRVAWSATADHGGKGAGSERTECLWINPHAQRHAPGLFDAVTAEASL